MLRVPRSVQDLVPKYLSGRRSFGMRKSLMIGVILWLTSENLSDSAEHNGFFEIDVGSKHVSDKHWSQREALIEKESRMAIGGRMTLKPKEQEANKIFMRLKRDELYRGFKDNELAAGMHFFEGKPLIERGKVFQVLKKMPKGSALHLHPSAAVSSEWFIQNITYTPGVMMCSGKSPQGFSFTKFTLMNNKSTTNCQSELVSVADERKKANDVKKFDIMLEESVNMALQDSKSRIRSIERSWLQFQTMFSTVGFVITYIPVYKRYIWRVFEELEEDNVFYAELRISPQKLYGDDHVFQDPIVAVDIFVDILRDFKKLNPDFLGAKLIWSVRRGLSNAELADAFDMFKALHKKYPDVVVGFDLVGEEDKGRPLIEIMGLFQNMPETNANYYFHAGETNWYGTTVDRNLIEAILYNSKRIGHGTALFKHPILFDMVKQKDIAIEISPISNQVLSYVGDLRTHPAAMYFAHDLPIVITNDDPGFFNSKALSYDFYYAIMSFSSASAGLETLKQLVYNSIKYSGLCKNQKPYAYRKLNKAWANFVDQILREFA